ncbi:hypothetical protein J2X07_000082 [Fictibacillus barbaricus]|uniref:Transposase n=1 Tax=Fictibacillus barbaricus TaxID=182136 RepID=A0ABU1TV68_9BACL|nr:hypothetical protein [Fictibacillus barbaricus]
MERASVKTHITRSIVMVVHNTTEYHGLPEKMY